MASLKIEVLYPEAANLYGDNSNYRYIAKATETEIMYTSIGSRPSFLDEKKDLVCIGSMTEVHQVAIMDELQQYKKEILTAVENGQHILSVGNSMELFGRKIIDVDDMPYGNISERIDTATKTTECLGLFDYFMKRRMMHRNNTFFVATCPRYDNINVTGGRCSFTYGYYGEGNDASPAGNGEPLFDIVRGEGFNPDITCEGFRYKNFIGTLTVGPLLIMNPDFATSFMEELGVKNPQLPYVNVAREAFDIRMKEYMDPTVPFKFS